MNDSTLETFKAGDLLPQLRLPAITRTRLALFAGASGDHNPIHIDQDFARRSGMPDVFAHGMLGMAYLGHLLTHWVPQSSIREFSVRFMAITDLGDEPILSGRIIETFEQHGEVCARVEVQMANQSGHIKILGNALVGSKS